MSPQRPPGQLDGPVSVDAAAGFFGRADREQRSGGQRALPLTAHRIPLLAHQRIALWLVVTGDHQARRDPFVQRRIATHRLAQRLQQGDRLCGRVREQGERVRVLEDQGRIWGGLS